MYFIGTPWGMTRTILAPRASFHERPIEVHGPIFLVNRRSGERHFGPLDKEVGQCLGLDGTSRRV